MTGFVITLISVALLNGALSMLAPEGEMRKYVKLLGSLCLVCAIASPIFSAIKAEGGGLDGLFPDIPENESRYEDVYGEALAKGAEETLEKILKERAISDLNIKEGEIDFDISLERVDGEYRVCSAYAYIRDGGIFVDPRSVNDMVNELCGCACNIIYY